MEKQSFQNEVPGKPEKKFSRQRIDVNDLPERIVGKWNKPVLVEGFIPFPKKLLRSLPRVFSGADAMKELAVVLAVVDFNRPKLFRAPSVAFLAFVAGLPENEVWEILCRLEQKSYIELSGERGSLEIRLSGLLAKIEAETKEEGV